jgi:predicted AAA+ superfamily ATPase
MEAMIPRFFRPAKGSFFLFGPRGTGKSTWLRALMKDALWIDLLEPDTFRSYSARPERLRELVFANKDKRVIVIDEIQKIPDLLSVVHLLIEKKQGWQFVLTGSSTRKLKRTGVDLLAGRVLKLTLHPFMAAELGKSFILERALKYGMLPLVIMAPEPREGLKNLLSSLCA